jgi:hypothetical protein
MRAMLAWIAGNERAAAAGLGLLSAWNENGPGRRGRLSVLSVFPSKSVSYGTFVWGRRALNSQKRRFPAPPGSGGALRCAPLDQGRAERDAPHGAGDGAEAEAGMNCRVDARRSPTRVAPLRIKHWPTGPQRSKAHEQWPTGPQRSKLHSGPLAPSAAKLTASRAPPAAAAAAPGRSPRPVARARPRPVAPAALSVSRWRRISVCRWRLISVSRWRLISVSRWRLISVCRWRLIFACRGRLIFACRLIFVCRWPKSAGRGCVHGASMCALSCAPAGGNTSPLSGMPRAPRSAAARSARSPGRKTSPGSARTFATGARHPQCAALNRLWVGWLGRRSLRSALVSFSEGIRGRGGGRETGVGGPTSAVRSPSRRLNSSAGIVASTCITM